MMIVMMTMTMTLTARTSHLYSQGMQSSPQLPSAVIVIVIMAVRDCREQ